MGSRLKPVFLSIVTNGFTRILRLDNVPPAKAQTQADDSREEETKEQIEKVLRFRTFIKMVNISICTTGKELLTVYLKGISAIMTKTRREASLHFDLMSI